MEPVNCSTVENAKTIFAVYVATSAMGSLLYAAAIFVITKTRIYKQLVHRLTLYLSIGGMFRAAAHIFHVLPVDIEQAGSSFAALRKGGGWSGVCVFGAAITQYAGFVQTLTVLWICGYIFMIAVFSKRLGEKRHEIFGIVTIILGPVLFSWEPFVTDSYGFDSVACGIREKDCQGDHSPALGYKIGLNVVPQLLMTLIGLALLMISVVVLAARARRLDQGAHILSMYAIKKIWLSAIYPFFYSLIYVGRMLGLAANVDTTKSDVITLSLLEVASATVPFSLLLQREVRQSLCACVHGGRGEKEKLTLSTTINPHGD